MTNYGRANRTTAWYQDNFPGADMNPNCGVLHTTETSSLPGYKGGATAPTYTAVPNKAERRLHWYAHFPDEKSSRALKNLEGGVQTNTLNVVQVELVGTCQRGGPGMFWPDAPDWALEDLADFLRYCQRTHGIPLSGPKNWLAYGADDRRPGVTPASYGKDNPARMSFAQWRNFRGWCGHQHVPENVHGDPGRLDFARLIQMAGAGGAKPPASVGVATPRWDEVWEIANGIVKSYPNLADAQTVKTIAARHSSKH